MVRIGPGNGAASRLLALFDGTVEAYDPWDAAHRTTGPQYDSSTMCSAFRTFQGWTALSDMAHDQGVLHAVPKGWGNVMYIPAAPWCPRNEQYAAAVREAFSTGSSPRDFPDENYERDCPNRFQLADLNETGRRGLGLD